MILQIMKKFNILFLLFFFAAQLSAQITPGEGNILYVKKGGIGNGSSWSSSLGEVADALKYAKQNEMQWTESNPLQIWVAAGYYTPLYDPSDVAFGTVPTTNKRLASFLLVNNVQLYGGFPTSGNPTMNDRNWKTKVTTLYGEIGTYGNSDNVYNVVLSVGTSTKPITSKTILDGFNIYGGNGNLFENRTVNGISIRLNEGSGMYNVFSSATITNVKISGNSAYEGGGMYNKSSSSPRLNSVTISGNFADSSGGGMCNDYSSPVLTNTIISGNSTNNSAGGIKNNYASPILTNVIISDNSAKSIEGFGGGFGGAVLNYYSTPTFTNVTIVRNSAATDASAMYNYYSSNPKIYNSIILGTITSDSDFIPDLQYSLVQGFTNTSNGNINSTGVNETDIFVDVVNKDYRLKYNAIVVNKGDNTKNNIPLDVLDNSRIVDGTIDLGSYENQFIIIPTNNILYVKKGATGNGSSWSNALGEVADALKFAKRYNTQFTESNPLQIWVAAGSYKPLYDAADDKFGTVPTAEPRLASFLLVNNVQLYGGFAGTEVALIERNWNVNKTILSGDIGSQGIYSDNVYQVVLSIGTSTNPITKSTILDGFTITGGYGSSLIDTRKVNGISIGKSNGAGMYNRSSSPTLVNVNISDNIADYAGGGMYNDGSSPALTNVIISGNSATRDNGGGLYNLYSNPTLTNVTIIANKAYYSRSNGLYSYKYVSNSGKINIYNSILIDEIFSSNTNFDIQYSLVKGFTDTTNGNINSTGISTSSLFVDVSAKDYRLKDDAVVINKGDNTKNNIPLDILGNSRIVDGTIDLGAYENQYNIFPVPTNNILYVKKGSTGNGSSWDNALGELADALKYAKRNSTQWTDSNMLQIWVAAGTYKPLYDPEDSKFGSVPLTDPRLASFRLINNIQLYGGFPASGTPTMNDRNWNANKTILSGEIGSQNSFTDNIYQVILSVGTSTNRITNNTVLDGFTIADGYASGNNTITRVLDGVSLSLTAGGGIYNNYSSPKLTNVTISGNSANFGGGMYNYYSSPLLTNVTVSGNTASTAGGINNYYSHPVLTNVILSGNFSSSSNYGTIYNYFSNPKIYNSIILGNQSGMVNYSFSNTVDIQYSLVQGLTDTTNGNISSFDISENDIFVSPITPGRSNAGDFHLKDGAIVINKGDNTKNIFTVDLAGNPRIFNNTIDLGAFENQNNLAQPTDNILYVKKGSIGNGSSWSNALGELADALRYAKENKNLWTASNPLLIWVAAGTYNPLYDPADATFGRVPKSYPRQASFLLVDNVQLYGGFEGTETNLNARNWNTNKTILSGDIGTQGNRTDNVYQVIISIATQIEPITKNTVVDGFTITGGFGAENTSRIINGYNVDAINGAGMYNTYSSPKLANLIISGNYVPYNGGGMFNYYSFPTLTNVMFTDNSASRGGGMANWSSSPKLTNVTFSLNNAQMFGGGMYNIYSSPTITSATFSGNHSIYYGGGMYNDELSSTTLANVIISGNTASESGGGIYNNNASSSLNNVTISGNYAYTSGGGMMNAYHSTSKIYNSIIWGNTSGIINNDPSLDVVDIQYSLVQDLTDTSNGNISSTGITASDIFVSPIAPTKSIAGDYRLKDGAPVINKGDNSKYDVSVSGTIDLAGNTRIVGSVIDLGAYENQNNTTLAVTDTVVKVKAMVYPNPTTGIFFVKTAVTMKAALYDQSGKLVKSINLKIGENQVDISGFTQGMYLLKTEQGVFKVIKK